MKQTTLTLHTKFQHGPVDPRVFGGFLEHMGRAVYEGVYQPDSAYADAEGCRQDVLDALRQLNMTAMRYPGGNFASGYHWQDGIGPKADRPTTRDLAWNSIEPNQFGTDEYIDLCRKMGWTPMITVNLGTGTPEEARNWVEYCNLPHGTRYADMRPGDPHGVKLWCLGNEMDGQWQIGHVPADQYAIRAQQAANMMKMADPTIELVACGSCSINLPTYMAWDQTVLAHLGDVADYISLHRYVGNQANDTPNYLAVSNSIDRQIEEMDAVCRFVQAKRRSKKRAYLCFDEWNVWYKNGEMDGVGKLAPHLIEEVYNLEDALVVAGFLNSFIRHADVVKIANLAQIVNVIAPLLTKGDDLLVQSIFYPFEMMSRRRNGLSLQVALDGSGYESAEHGWASLIDASAILDDDKLHCFLVNRSVTDAQVVQITPADTAVSTLINGELLTGPDAKAANSWEAKDVVGKRPFSDIRINNGAATVELPPLSMAALTLQLER
jgi:alpha-N-arabinofuranosidase